MAEKIVRQLVDDLDGSDAVVTRRFTIDGRSYRLDLSERNNERFEKALAPYVSHATVEGGRRSVKKAAASGRDFDIAALRAWAKKKRIDVPARGRIPAAVVEQFKAANPS